jgi:hypothetical protein
MKAGVAVATFLMASGLIFAARGPDDIALVNKYKDVDFDVGSPSMPALDGRVLAENADLPVFIESSVETPQDAFQPLPQGGKPCHNAV